MRIAVAGAQCTGKSTLIKALLKEEEFKGYVTNSRGIRYLHKRGFNIYNGEDATELASLVLRAKDLIQLNIFLDRSIIDSITYRNFWHIRGAPRSNVVPDFMDSIAKELVLYLDKVIFLKPEFPLTTDGVRDPDEDHRIEVTEMMEDTFEFLGIEETKIIRTITGTVEERVKQCKKELL